jgi:ribosomal protein S18 acetylase RimI-like enzyme
MPQITYRPATTSDAAAIAALHTASWRDAYAAILDPDFLAGPIEADRMALWQGRLGAANADQVVEVAQTPDGEVVGFVCAFRNADPQWGSLVDNLHAAPHMRGNGLGERLLRSAAASLARNGGAEGGVHLWVFEANTAGLRFYKRLGGRVVGQTVSKMATAPGQVSLRVHWPKIEDLASA